MEMLLPICVVQYIPYDVFNVCASNVLKTTTEICLNILQNDAFASNLINLYATLNKHFPILKCIIFHKTVTTQPMPIYAVLHIYANQTRNEKMGGKKISKQFH